MKGFQLQKRITLSKNIWLNISKSGIGYSVGLLGVRISNGPRGAFLNVDLPGTGLRYRKQLRSAKSGKNSQPQSTPAQAEEKVNLPDPGLFAPGHEKELVKGLEDFHNGQEEQALKHFIAAAAKEPGAAILAAFMLADQDPTDYRPITLLEGVIQTEVEFPTPLMQEYLADFTLDIEITPDVVAEAPVNGLAAPLLLVELYQKQRRVREAISLLEQLTEASSEPTLTLSLCELYASREMWDQIIEQAKNIEPEDDITLKIVIFYGQAMQQKGLHTAAIAVFSKALRRTKNKSQPLLNETRYWRAISYQAEGDTSKARQELEMLYAENPDFHDVAGRLAALLNSSQV